MISFLLLNFSHGALAEANKNRFLDLYHGRWWFDGRVYRWAGPQCSEVLGWAGYWVLMEAWLGFIWSGWVLKVGGVVGFRCGRACKAFGRLIGFQE